MKAELDLAYPTNHKNDQIYQYYWRIGKPKQKMGRPRKMDGDSDVQVLVNTKEPVPNPSTDKG